MGRRGQKACTKCNAMTGPRSIKCPKCGNAFVFKHAIFKPEAPIETNFDWKALQKGERIKVISGTGPVWPKKNEAGEDIYLGYHGKFVVVRTDSYGIIAMGNKREGEHSTCHIYMGVETLSKNGLLRKPHKVVKLKPKKDKNR